MIISGLLILVVSGSWAANKWWPSFGDPESETPTALVRNMTIPDIVVEQGTLESQQSIKGICKAEGYEFKIIKIVPEGTQVSKGQVVVEFDSSEVVKDIAEQELEIQEADSEVQEAIQTVKVQENENESSIRLAQQEYDFAQIDLNKYVKGDFEVNKSDHEAQISEAQEKVDQATRAFDNMQALVKKGFRQVEQLREAETVVKSAKLRLKQNKQKYEILLKFEHVKSLAQAESKVEESEFKLKAAKETATAKLAQAKDALDYRKRRLDRRKERLDRYKKNLEEFKIAAPDSGTVAYPTEGRYWGAQDIREGATVYQNQTVFTLPNMRKMQVKVGIHESLISKVKPGLPATVKIDAFAGRPFQGTLTKVAPLAEQSRFSSSKAYNVIVVIDEIPEDIALKPGMTAQVEILAGRYPNVTAVPIQAVVSNSGKKFVYVRDGSDFERREVEVGHSNVSFVEITSGIEVGEEVALDAFQRSIVDFGNLQPEELLAEEGSDEPFDPATVKAPELPPDDAGEGTQIGMTSDETGGNDDPPRPLRLNQDDPPRPHRLDNAPEKLDPPSETRPSANEESAE